MIQHRRLLTVSPDAIDQLGHVNNIEYVRWMQDVAVSHSDSVGCTAATQADGAAWVARRHVIEYLRPAFAGDRIEARTWVGGGRRASSIRNYEFVRVGGEDEVLLARGETEWVYVDLASGRPRSVPDAIRALFPSEA
jgi:acyl-CoA thioester hydrolase